MANDKVVPITKGNFIPGIRNEPDQEVIAELERLVDLARSGEIVGVAYATFWSDKSIGNRYVGRISNSLVGGLFAVMSRVNKQLDEDTT